MACPWCFLTLKDFGQITLKWNGKSKGKMIFCRESFVSGMDKQEK
jgi:hypothetical protein